MMKKLMLVLLMLVFCAAYAEENWAVRRVINCEEWVSLRAEPDTSAERLAKIELGAEVEARNFDGVFAECRYQGQQGYVLGEYLGYENEPVSAEGTLLPNVSEFLSLRRSTSASSETLMQIRPGTEMELLGWSGKFAKVRVDGVTGYVNTGYTQAKGGDLSRWPYDYAAMLHDIEALGDAVEVEIIGMSADNREIPVLRFGNGNIHILIQAGIHGREIMTGRLAMDLLTELVNEYPNGVKDVTFHVIPISNPDGNTIAIHGPEGLKDAELRQEVIRMLGDAEARQWKSNARGVDLNRNFDAEWENLEGKTPGTVTYRGERPHSEPESVALVEYTKRYPFAATVSYHSFGSLLYWEGMKGTETEKRTMEMAGLFESLTGYPLSRSESSTTEKGGYKDWALMQGIPSITVEIGAADSIGSLEEYTAILLRNRGTWIALADWCRR